MGKGNNTTTSTSSTGPTAQAGSVYGNLLSQIQNVAGTPYQAYSGQLVAPVNAQQQAGIAGINTNANYAAPQVQQAAGLASGAANPLTQNQIQSYYSPYQQNVVNATQAQFNNQNAQQQARLTGNTIAQGALGGNRAGIAQGVLAGQQQLAQAPVIAGLENQGYQSALTTAAQQYQQNPLNAANSIANFGIAGQNAALTGANAQLGAGTVQQQTQQAQDTAALNQFLQQQAYPFQTTQWEAGLAPLIGSQLGTTSSGSTTSPSPSVFSQIAGLGLTALSLIPKAEGGAVHRATSGGVSGTPYGNVAGYIPAQSPMVDREMSRLLWRGDRTAPFPRPYTDNSGVPGVAGLSKQLQGYQGSLGNDLSGPAYGGGNILTDAYGGSSSNPLPGLDASDYGTGFARGGSVAGLRGYADGGDPSDDVAAPDNAGADDGTSGLLADRFAAVKDAIASGAFDPQGINDTTFAGAPGIASAADGPVPLPMARPPGAPISSGDDPDAEPAPMPRPGLAGAPAPIGPMQGPGPEAAQATSLAPQDEGSGLFHLSPNVRQGLLAAGLGMMASRSPFFGVAVGQGGLAGLGAYNAARSAQAKQALNEKNIEIRAQDLAQRAKAAQLEYGARIAAEAETHRHNEAAENSYLPVGSVMSGNSMHPLVMDRSSGQVLDAVTNKPPAPDSQFNVKGGQNLIAAKQIGDGIMSGKLPPTLKGLYRNGAPVQAYLGQKGFDLSKAQLQYRQAEKQITSLNGPQMVRFVGLAHSVDNTIDEVRELSQQLGNIGIPVLNHVNLARLMQTAGNTEKGQLAARYLGAVNTLKEEFANLANGGYAPTDPAWALANEQINGNYGVNQLGASLGEVQRLIRYRVNGIPGLAALGPGAANRYTGQTGEAPLPAPTPASAQPGRAAQAQVPPPASRGVGEIYPTPKGPLKWTGQGWVYP